MRCNSLYIFDLHPLQYSNFFAKFANVTYLIVGAEKRYAVHEGINGIKLWTTANNLRLNTTKSKEMLVSRTGILKWMT